jgi:hypothetical protein
LRYLEWGFVVGLWACGDRALIEPSPIALADEGGDFRKLSRENLKLFLATEWGGFVVQVCHRPCKSWCFLTGRRQNICRFVAEERARDAFGDGIGDTTS